MTTARFPGPRHALVLSAGVLCTVGPFFACVESEGAPNPEDGGASDALTLPESTPEDAGSKPEAASSVPEAGSCSDSGFCLVPLPTLDPLVSVAASSIDDAWAISPERILRWDGATWTTAHRSPNANFFGIAVTKPDDVWVLGWSLVARYSARDGGPPALREYPGAIQDKGDWTTGFWVSPAGDQVWIAVDSYPTGPAVFRYREEFSDAGNALIEDGMTTSEMGFPWTGEDETFSVYSVFGFGPKDVYVGGLWCAGADCSTDPEQDRYGAIAHYDGEHWAMVSQLGKGERVSAIYGTTAPDQSRQLWIWAGIAGQPGNSIRLLPSRRDGTVGPAQYSRPVRTDPGPFSTIGSFINGCHRVQGSIPSPTKAWFSDVCLVYRWNGTALDLTPTTVRGVPMGSVTGLWAGANDEAWLVGAAPSPIPDQPPVGFAAIRRSAP